jgi:GNAT superfamily N-acetyltransferase
VTEIQVAVEPFDSADARRLVAALDAGLSELYPPEQRFGPNFKAHHAAAGRGTFLVARVAGEAAGCGGMRVLDPATAEVKRMYVVPGMRGRGVARAVLARLEAEARAFGIGRLMLETGIHQLEAIRLYERAGYSRVECWGEYSGVPTSVCYQKDVG